VVHPEMRGFVPDVPGGVHPGDVQTVVCAGELLAMVSAAFMSAVRMAKEDPASECPMITVHLLNAVFARNREALKKFADWDEGRSGASGSPGFTMLEGILTKCSAEGFPGLRESGGSSRPLEGVS